MIRCLQEMQETGLGKQFLNFFEEITNKLDVIIQEQKTLRSLCFSNTLPEYRGYQDNPLLLQECDYHPQHENGEKKSNPNGPEFGVYASEMLQNIDIAELGHELADEQSFMLSDWSHSVERNPLNRFNKIESQHYNTPGQQLKDPSKLLEYMNEEFKKMDLTFTECECVLSYPQMKNTDFHSKIDDKNNLLVLVQLSDGQLVGVFSEVGLSSKSSYIPLDNPKCCMFNLTTNFFLYAYKTNKTHSYNKKDLIFGNEQFKLNMREGMLSSNLGTSGDCFRRCGYEGRVLPVSKMKQNFFGEDWQQSWHVRWYCIYALK